MSPSAVQTGTLLDPCPLRPHWPDLLQAAAQLGPLRASTPNRAAELEGPCSLDRLAWHGNSAHLREPGIELRMQPAAWARAQATANPGETQRLQFIDARGEIALALGLPPEADPRPFAALLEAWRLEERCERRALLHGGPARPRATADRAALLQAWSELRDTRNFPGLLARFGLSRMEALHLAEGRFSEPTGRATAALLLEMAAIRRVPLAIFVGNPGCIQIASGPMEAVRCQGAWVHAQGPAFSLRINRTYVDRAWIVTKPSAAGAIHSLELFDAQGEVVAQCFGHREPGAPESVAWRVLLQDLGASL